MADQYQDQPYESGNQVPEPPRKQRGCFFYGCITAGILLVLGTIGTALVGYMGYRWYMNLVENYTDTQPRALPKVEATPEQQKEVDGRVQTFNDKVEKGEAAEPLILTAQDLNMIIASDPRLRNRVYITIKEGKISGEISVPLDELQIPGAKGRYLNGKTTLQVALDEGQLYVTLDELEVRGQTVPKEVMAQLRAKNLAEEFNKDPKNTEKLRKYKSVVVQDDKIIITPRSPSQPLPEGAPPTGAVPPDAVLPPPAEAPAP